MCVRSCIDFTRSVLVALDVQDREVLEVGSLDVNGSVRGIVAALGPRSYVGVDIEEGPGVDEVCDVHALVARHGRDAFDVVITTEMLEHVRDWRSAVANLKDVVRPGGILVITTRSPGFKYHGYPFDYWRYTRADMELVLRDFELEAVQDDPLAPGIFVKARKPLGSTQAPPSLAGYALFSIIHNGPALDVTDDEVAAYLNRTKIRRSVVTSLQDVGSRLLPSQVKQPLKRTLPRRFWQ